MKFRLLSALIVLLLALALFAACVDSDGDDGTSSETPEATTSTATLAPGPVQTMPPGKEVEFQILPGHPSRYKHDLTVAFRGGKGQNLLKKEIDLRVTKSTGEVVTEVLKPNIGNEVIITDAEGKNRVEVTVSLVTGGTYKIIDKIVEVP